MKHTDKSYEQWLKELRQLEISPKNPEQLNRKILDGIDTLPQCPKTAPYPFIQSVVSGIAAVLIIGFFIYELLKISPFPTPAGSPALLFSVEAPSQKNYSMQDKIKLYADQIQHQQEKGKKQAQWQTLFQTLNLKNQIP